MQLDNPCVHTILNVLKEAFKTKTTVSFNAVMAAPKCRKYSVREIGQALELLRKNGLVTATSRFGCSELLEFTATGITEKGEKF